ncbi:hypothetical protein PAECIP111802_07378 [Paenibacillus allorhizosphaerae]|uniref:Uncharacterized protein n=1 Tax=Paenibacillus allorhizosphaerae TaxID=2849866 RepID=A0ABM8VV33_9BACL|nr:hypothetical protein PAECIP111802_07378 [Paenibacillus allorhizosphaerae]
MENSRSPSCVGRIVPNYICKTPNNTLFAHHLIHSSQKEKNLATEG